MTINVPVVLFGYETYYIYHNVGHATLHTLQFSGNCTECVYLYV